MKKLLLTSIIMFGVCGFITAQNTVDSKAKFKSTSSTTSATAVPQKAASTNDLQTTRADGTVVSGADATVPVKVNAAEAKAATADDVQMASDLAKKKEMEKAKAEAPKAATVKKGKDN